MPDAPAVVRQLARALADGHPIHWPSALRLARTSRDLSQLQQLQDIAWLERRSHDAAPDEGIAATRHQSVGERLIQILATIHVACGALTFVWLGSSAYTGMLPAQAAIMTAFAVTAIVLSAGGRTDRRAVSLAHLFLLVAAALARPLLHRATDHPLLGWLGWSWQGWYTEAFLGAAAWRFARAFPLTLRFTVVDRLARRVGGAATFAGALLFAVNAALAWLPAGVVPAALAAFQREDQQARFWDVTDLLLLGAMITIGARTAMAVPEERRRVAWVGATLALGFAPLLGAAAIAVFWPEIDDALHATLAGRVAVDGSVLAGLLLTPVVTAYAVVVQRVFTIRVVVRRALQYALARYTLAAAIAVPLLWLTAQAYALRARPLAEIADAPGIRRAAWACAAALLLLATRTWLLRLLDRLLVGRKVAILDRLPKLAERVGRARTAREVAAAAADEVVESLGIDVVCVLSRGTTGRWASLHGDTPAPAPDGALVEILPPDDVVSIGPEQEIYRLLPLVDRGWVDETRVEYAIGLATPAGALVGMLAVGGRRNGFPLAREEMAFLAAVAGTTSLALDLFRRAEASATASSTDLDEVAAECATCGSIAPAPGRCDCGAVLGLAKLPMRVGDKFALVRCLGRGGMGVVYQGRDLRLDRFVALKTLPVLDQEAADAMLDEARAMAAVEHPALAQIFGVEIWRRTPVLVAEYLPNGTLAARLRDGPLDSARMLDIAVALADGLAALHDRGILHRDIKPSNIGFSRAGTPKLLDFGLARLIERSGHRESGEAALRAESAVTRTSTLAGTPLYLSPEALLGKPPDVGRDLWSLSLVLYEAAVGEHPFRAPTVGDVLARVQEGVVDDVRRWRPDLPAGVAAFFRRALNVDPARRYRTARDLSAALGLLKQHPA